MAKIGTAHIEIKPVIDEAALDRITERVAAAVAEGVERGIRKASTTTITVGDVTPITTLRPEWDGRTRNI